MNFNYFNYNTTPSIANHVFTELPSPWIYGFITQFSFDSFSINTSSYTSCGKLQITNTTSGPFTRYRWLYNNKIIGEEKNLSYTFPRSGRYPITLLGVKADGCTTSRTDTFTFFAKPQARFQTRDSAGCQWVSIQFSDSSRHDTLNTAAGTRWTWDFGDGQTETYTKHRLAVSHVYTSDGSYTVRLIYSNGFCSDTFTQPQQIKILPAPRPGLRLSDTAGCAPLRIQVQDSSHGDVKSYTYIVSNGEKAFTSNPVFTLKEPGRYSIVQQLLSPTGCITTDTAWVEAYPGLSAASAPVAPYVTYTTDNRVMLSWTPYAGAVSYRIFKADNKSVDIQDTTWTDNAPGTDTANPPAYRLSAADACGGLSQKSDVASPIVLAARNDANIAMLLNWTAYQPRTGQPDYNIHLPQPDGTYKTAGNTTAQTWKDEDHFSNDALENCYRVGSSTVQGEPTFSNTICIAYLPALWIPNSFSPDRNGLNEVWRISAYGLEQAELSVYNRWGQLVFHTTDALKEGWTAASDPEGIYLYTLRARARTGEWIFRKGTVMLGR